jgi:pimeloyl-ACP methyl ester carboxylesterase
MRPAMGLGSLPEAIEVPALVLWGERDRLVPVSHAEKVCALIHDAELTVFPACGHCPQLEVPEAFNERVLRFLRERLGDPD